MKAILMSIRPKYVSMILNKTKTIEVRKRFPSDYVGWVNIYCTKEKPHLAKSNETKTGLLDLNGKVVARFWCDRVDEFYDFDDDLCKQACLDRGEMLDYLGNKKGYAIHITKLEIFDRPKELSEFEKLGSYLNPTIKCPKKDRGRCNEGISPFTNQWCGCERAKLTRAPQSYCFIEI